ncbi:MAG: efflux RND transporter periplasmic adaptor subunit [Pseudomonadota bacterium]
MTSRRLTRPVLLVLLVAVLAGGGYGGYRLFFADSAAPEWKFAAVERGPIEAAVSATGTLNPVVAVQVSSQISGQIREILVDYNSTVKAGQLVARLAPETYEHRVHQAEADLEAARATVAVQQAELYRAQVNLADAERDFERKQTLVAKNFISPAELDKAQTALEAARAQRRVVEAQARNSAALVRQREAQLGQARVDLSRTEIRAPVDGIVIKRSVEPGQTVAASLQAPEMFVIAQNLTDMQVETAIDEADVGRLRVGQEATFTVDAFPGKRFRGEVRQVRKAAQVVSNVVSYTVVISAANPELILLPGMTANVRIVTARKEGVLKVANAALRFRPPGEGGPEKSAPAGRRPGGPATSRVWVTGADGKPAAIEVKTGITDGTQTELTEGDLQEGRELIVGLAAAPDKAKAARPRMF